MMRSTGQVLKRAVASGTAAGIAMAAATALAGKRETGFYAAPLNATSHILWGEKAAAQNEPSLKYTLTGFVLNYAAGIFWAAIYEKYFGEQSARPSLRGAPLRPLMGSAIVTAGAYVTDYYLVPERLTPGFEKRLSGRSLFAGYCMLMFGLAARDLISRKNP